MKNTATGAVLVAGTASGVGKSTIVAGLCRSFARSGASVAPFKAQNMSNHAAVASDGGEIGRAQAMQALAARVPASVHMNPILIKPGPNQTSHVVVRGQEVGTATGFDLGSLNRRDIVLDAYRSVANTYGLVVAEGAGGAAEINLLNRDIVNLPFAAASGMASILVVDIDRGGAFASAFGTVKILPDELRQIIQGIVINSFRGDPAHLGDGMAQLAKMTGVPVLGVLPHLGPTPLLGVEDSLDVTSHPVNTDELPTLRVAVVALPHLANPSDFDPLVLEPSVALTWARRPADVLGADLVVVPGSRATVQDLEWVKRSGIGEALRATSAQVLGICGGYQMLGNTIDDQIESGQGRVLGLGLLDVDTVFTADKVVQRDEGTAHLNGTSVPVTGYQIRLGKPSLATATDHMPLLQLSSGGEGAQHRDAQVMGTSLHGIFDSDDARRVLLTNAARRAGAEFEPNPQPFAKQLDEQHDRLADWVEEHLDVDQVATIAGSAADPDVLPGWPAAG